MNDENEVEAVTPGEVPAEETAAAKPEETAPEAEVAAAVTPSEVPDASRTGYAAKGLRAGDTCVCPDGRTGTVHQYDAGLICMPNHDQG